MKPCLWLLPPVGMVMLAIPGAASAQSYPATRVRIITAAAGGGSDY